MRNELLEAYRQVKQIELDKRTRNNEIRRLATYLYWPNKPYRWRWWRMAFECVFGERYRESDLTIIPGYDELAQELSHTFPEFEGIDGCQDLWKFLMSPYDPMPSKSAMMADAVELVRQRKREAAELFAFGANVEFA